MRNELLAREEVASHSETLSFLKGKDNPFEVFVAARKPDADFYRLHVPAINEDLFRTLLKVVERFRPERLHWESDVPRSGVVVVRGARGTGKTHMIHALARSREQPHVLVTPAIFEPHRPFIEYLLHQLVRHFQGESDGNQPGTLELLADALARQVVVQAYHGMSEIDWLARSVPRWSFFSPTFLRFFFGIGTRRLSDRKRALIADLEKGDIPSIREVCAQNEQDADELHGLARQQIERMEVATTIAGQIRRGLYVRLVDVAFGDGREPLYDFLLDGYTQVEARTQPSRETLVDELFQALVELCLLARMPVVFAFDALETLLGDPPETRLCHPFTKGLAEVLDSHRGIPFLIFAEYGHWQKAQLQMSEYARQRFQQGVIRVPDHGSISLLEIPPVSAGQLRQIVTARIRPFLEECFQGSEIDVEPIFPFREEDLKRIARADGDEPPLRMALQALRDRYDELVNGKPAPYLPTPVAVPEPVSFQEPLESLWHQKQREAKKRLAANTLSSLADELHAGAARWLEFLIALGDGIPAGKPTSVANETFGNHPTYGQITRFEWEHDGQTQTIGLGFLVGSGPGMKHDLETKLKKMNEKSCSLDRLVLLWPREADAEGPVHENFPRGTREVWDGFDKKGVTRKVILRLVPPASLAPWLGLPAWQAAVREELGDMPSKELGNFLGGQTESLLTLIAPED